MKRILLFLVVVLVTLPAIAQTNLPVLKAENSPVGLSEDGLEQPWFVNSKLRPDVKKTSAKNIVFRSAIDTLSFKLEKGGTFDFVILINGSDSAFTRVE